MNNSHNVVEPVFVRIGKQRQWTALTRLATALLIALLASFTAPEPAVAATVYWSNTAGTSDWTAGSNWDGNTAPVDDLISDLAGFRSSSYVTQPSVGAARQVAGVVVAGTSAAVSLGGTSVLTLGQGGITVNAGAGILTISAPLALGASQTWLTNGTNLVTVSGAIDLGNHTLTSGGWNSAGTNHRVFSGVISGSGGSLVKTGSGTLTLNRDNPSSGAPNTFDGGVRIVQGILQVESPAMGAADGAIINNPLGTGAVRLAGGQLNLRVDGDNSSTVRGYTYGNDLIVENALSTISLDRRTSSGGTNRNLLFNSLTLDNGYLTVTTGSSYRLGITGDILLVGHGVINGGDVTNFNTGRITDAGKGATFNKIGGATFNLLGTGNDYSGGTVVHGGTLRVGSGYGTTVTNATAVAGTGPIVVNPGAAATFLSSGNLATGQTVHVISHRSGLGVFSMQFNAPPDALRTTGSGVLAFTGTNNHDIDLARLGDGTWTLGSFSGTGSGTFNGTLSVGAGNVYRLGGASGTLTVGGTANMLTGSASLEVGRALINAGTPGQGTGTVVLNAANDFAGGTLVNRGSTLRIQQGGANNPLGAGAVHVFGTLTAEGAAGSFINAGGTANNNAITLYGGSTLRFDNSGLSTGTNVDRWEDNTPIHLLAGTLQLDARNHASVTNETVGAILFTGGNTISLTRANQTGQNVQLTTAEFVRTGQGTIEFTRSSNSGYDTNTKILASVVPPVVNGMIAPFFVLYDNTHNARFATYNEGFLLAGIDRTVSSASFTAGLTDGTQKVYVDPTAATTLGDNPYIHALKTAQSINAGTGTSMQIGSGGLIVGGVSGTSARTITIAPSLYFGDGTARVEGMVYVDSGWTGVLSGTITADGLTKFGAGTAVIRSDNSSTMTTGAVSVNRGSLQLEHAAAVGSRPIVLAGGQLNLRAATATTFNNAVTLGQNIPIATIDVRRPATSGDNQTLTIPTLTLEGSATPQGQTLTLAGANNFDLAVSGATTVTGNATFHVNTSGVELYLNGGLNSTTPGAVISKSGGQRMRIQGNGTFAAGSQVHLNGGTLELRGTSSTAAASTPLGAGTDTVIYLNAGTLDLRTNSSDSTFGGETATTGGYHVVVAGNSTINLDRYAGSSTGRRVGIGSLSIGSNMLTVNSGNSYYFGVNGPVEMTGSSIFNMTAPIPDFYGQVSGGRLIKQGSAALRLHAGDDVNTYDGGSVINQGWLYGYNAGGLGLGDILVNPGGGVAMGKATTLHDGQIAAIRSSTLGLGMVGINYSAAPSTLLPNLDLTNAPAGIFAGGGDYRVSLDLGNLFGDTVSGDDRWYLGAIAWTDTYYRADALAPGAENTYRLGGGRGNMQINRNNATPSSGGANTNGNNLLTGSASVTVGMPANNLRSHANSGVLILGTNDYTGGTVIHRGMTLHLGSEATSSQSGAGTGVIDVYGELRLRTRGTLTDGNGGNVNLVVAHPGAAIRLDNGDTSIGGSAVNMTDRWGDSTGVILDGSRLALYGTSNAISTETVGEVTFDRGSSLLMARSGSGRAYLTVADLVRSGSGTMLIRPNGNLLPSQGTPNNSERLIVTSFNTSAPVTHGMAPAYFIDANSHNFVTYNASAADDGNTIGFQQATYESTNLNTASSTQKVDVTAAVTLTTNPTVYALRTNSTITSSGANNTITIRSGGLIARGGTINPNLVFDDGTGPSEALVYTSANTVVAGAITASQITKFGTGGELQFDSPTPVFDGPIVVNDGLIRLLTLNALGANATITLNGGGSANSGDTSGHGIVFAANTGGADEVAYTHGNVTSWDNNRIVFIPGGNDRTQTVGDFIMKATGELSVMQLRIEGSRNRINTGSITLESPEAILHVHNNSFASGASSVIAPAALVGDGKSVTKLGSAILELGDLTGSLSNSSLTVGQGALRVFSGASLGSSNTIVIDRGAALEIAGSNFSLAGTTTLTQVAGSAERWNVEDARGAGDYVLPQGVTLQLNTSIMPDTARTITLTGGSLEPFLYSDSSAQAVFRIVGSNVTIDLADHSYLGQNVLIGTTGADMGQTNLMTAGLLSTAFRGAGLVVQGQITGAGFDLTKIGNDIVILSGATSTYRNTIVDQGLLQIGANNALPIAGVLTTRLDGVFDLNGYDQQVGNLGVQNGIALDGTSLGYSGTIVNSAYAISTLTAGNAIDHTYRGVISGNIALVKTGTGTLTLGGANTYIGPTTINQGTLSVALVADGGLASHLGASSSEASNLAFDGGTLRYTGTSATTNRHFTLGAAGGTIEVAGLETLALTMTGVGQGSGGLTKGGSGSLVLDNHQQYDGGTTVSDGVLRVTTAGSLKHNASDKVFIAADADNDFATPGARLVRQIAHNQAYDGLGSQMIGGRGTRADIAKGVNTSGGIRDLSMAWREPSATEPTPLGYIGLVSDVLELAGMAESGGPHGESDLFVLTMSYDPAALNGRETELASTGNLYLAWLDPVDGWENAVLGNFGATESFVGVGAWTDFVDGADLAASLGHWGVDLGQHLVWAVVNHNSQFAVMAVPEPSSLLLLGTLVGLFATIRRTRLRR